jgi:His/Glu/Gln/Arg/opine family amino acid ABC transporter permease subunit
MVYYFSFRVVQNNIGNMLNGLGLGLFIAVISLIFGIILGLIAAFAAVSSNRVLNIVSTWYTAFFRNTPLLVLVFITYFGLPEVGIMMERNISFIFTLSFYAGAYMTDVFRAGLQAIPNGIIEAGKTIGLSHFNIIRCIQLPIMFRYVLPSMSNYLVSLFKDTSIAASITVPELTYYARKLNVETFRVFEAWLTAAFLYVVTCYTITYLLRKIEHKLRIE